ncbi:hypothetical protein BDK51DRAFT_31201, partial [Blyttiomyces helicus]
ALRHTSTLPEVIPPTHTHPPSRPEGKVESPGKVVDLSRGGSLSSCPAGALSMKGKEGGPAAKFAPPPQQFPPSRCYFEETEKRDREKGLNLGEEEEGMGVLPGLRRHVKAVNLRDSPAAPPPPPPWNPGRVGQATSQGERETRISTATPQAMAGGGVQIKGVGVEGGRRGGRRRKEARQFQGGRGSGQGGASINGAPGQAYGSADALPRRADGMWGLWGCFFGGVQQGHASLLRPQFKCLLPASSLPLLGKDSGRVVTPTCGEGRQLARSLRRLPPHSSEADRSSWERRTRRASEGLFALASAFASPPYPQETDTEILDNMGEWGFSSLPIIPSTAPSPVPIRPDRSPIRQPDWLETTSLFAPNPSQRLDCPDERKRLTDLKGASGSRHVEGMNPGGWGCQKALPILDALSFPTWLLVPTQLFRRAKLGNSLLSRRRQAGTSMGARNEEGEKGGTGVWKKMISAANEVLGRSSGPEEGWGEERKGAAVSELTLIPPQTLSPHVVPLLVPPLNANDPMKSAKLITPPFRPRFLSPDNLLGSALSFRISPRFRPTLCATKGVDHLSLYCTRPLAPAVTSRRGIHGGLSRERVGISWNPFSKGSVRVNGDKRGKAVTRETEGHVIHDLVFAPPSVGLGISPCNLKTSGNEWAERGADVGAGGQLKPRVARGKEAGWAMESERQHTAAHCWRGRTGQPPNPKSPYQPHVTLVNARR